MVGALALATTAAGNAQDLPTPASVTATAHNSFVWVDGSWRSIGLPDYGLGFHNMTAANVDTGAVQNFTVRPTGYGVSGGIGYWMPPGALPAAFGSNVRIALQGGYVDATSDQNGSATSARNIGQLLNGQLFVQCAVNCTFASWLATRHEAGWVAATATGDVRIGPTTVRPVVEIFGGLANTDQTLSQSRDSLGNITSYYASTRVRWADVGAKVGVSVMVPLASAVEFGLGGKIGFAHRWVSLTGSDTEVFVPTSATNSSSIERSDATLAFLAGLHGQLTARPRPDVRLRAFAGLDYDSRVPGIVAPTFTPNDVATDFFGSPAGIGYSGRTSYYAGGGIVVALGP